MNVRNLFGRVLIAALGLSATGEALAARTTTYFSTDGLGSVVAATNETGAVLWRKDYAPYGEQLDTSNSSERLAYTGKQHDSVTGLTNFGARQYDPEIGRFLSLDPIGFIKENPMSFNRYAYASNNPYRYVDPDGQGPQLPSFEELWKNHPGGITPNEAYSRIGRPDAPGWGAGNACTIRMCMAFFGAGAPMVPAPGWHPLFRGRGTYQGVPMILTVEQFDKAMRNTYGAPTITIQGSDGAAAMKALAGKKGVIQFHITGWSDATGHFDLWNGSECKQECWWETNDPRVKLTGVDLWEAPSAPSTPSGK